MKHLKLGDIVEIETQKGLAYAQLTHRHPSHGELIRVLPGFFEKRPVRFDDLVSQPTKFLTFFPLRAAVTKRVVSIVGNEMIPAECRAFPLFRAGIESERTGKVETWWLWDGESERRIGALTPEQRTLPIRQVVNDTLLVEMIESDWTPETDPSS